MHLDFWGHQASLFTKQDSLLLKSRAHTWSALKQINAGRSQHAWRQCWWASRPKMWLQPEECGSSPLSIPPLWPLIQPLWVSPLHLKSQKSACKTVGQRRITSWNAAEEPEGPSVFTHILSHNVPYCSFKVALAHQIDGFSNAGSTKGSAAAGARERKENKDIFWNQCLL